MISHIKSLAWDKRVTRTGFLQSKQITCEAMISKVRLTDNITICYDNFLWVTDLNLYDDTKTKSFSKVFESAFEEDPKWPLEIINFFDNLAPKIDAFILKLVNRDYTNKVETFLEYVNLLISFQKYYTVAVALTNFCELKTKNEKNIRDLSLPYKSLDVEEMPRFLAKIKTEKDILDYLKKYEWVKTTYNLIEKYTAKEVRGEIKKIKVSPHTSKKKNSFVLSPFVIGLQVGIYLRNRMKELAQKLWFYIDPLVIEMSAELKISRDEFLQMAYEEVVLSYSSKKCVVSKKSFKERQKGYVVGFVDRKKVFIEGGDAVSLLEYFEKVETGTNKVKGQVACKGNVVGVVRVIHNMRSFKEFKDGEILVTRMTSPDFIPLLKKAKAIVTDEGGLSCHAAIVSRELGVPCVIGTKIATKIFKDGDKVEVDANSGFITKL